MWFVKDDCEGRVENYETAYETREEAVKTAWETWEHYTRSERRGEVIQIA